MIQPVQLFTCICDNCKKNILEHLGYSCVSKDWLDDMIVDSDWHLVKVDDVSIPDKHYCNDCVTIDDNDEIIIIETRFKPLA